MIAGTGPGELTVGILRGKAWWKLTFASVFLLLSTFSFSQTTPKMGGNRPTHDPKPEPQRGLQDVTPEPAGSGKPVKYYALVIGNNSYLDPKINKLQTPVNDALAVEQLLKDRYGFATQLLRNATRDQILTALVFYRRNLAPESNLLIYYAGHGYLDNDAGEAYWIPVDGERDNPMNWISADDVTRAVRAVPSRHVLVISDSCYSGAIISDNNGSRSFGDGITPREHLAYLARKQSSKSRDWMASGGVETVSDTGPSGHSIFAAALLQGLHQMKDEQFAASDLFYSFIQQKVGGNAPQLPQYGWIRDSGHDSGDFVFSRGGGQPPTAEDVPPEIKTPTGRILLDIPQNGGGSFDAEADRNAIKEVVHQYQEGRKRKDASSLWKIWPSAPVETKQRIEAYFKSASSIRTTLNMDTPDIAADHVSATFNGRIQEAYTPKNGTAPPAREDDIAFTLKKNNGTWVIVDVK